MATCFVIQPFDAGKFDKRFEEIFKPAIIAAGLDPYRVDQDAHVDILIESIEAGIRAAAVCLADISTDNPNVWFELGYALAAGTPLVMVCASEREGKKYPFDIQHRSIISYTTDAPGDFKLLQSKITERLQALMERGAGLKQLAEAEQVAPVEGLSQSELTVLAVVAGNVGVPYGKVSISSAQQDAERAGLTKLGFALGLRRLTAKKFLVAVEDEDYNGNTFDALQLTNDAWNWIEENESRFVVRRSQDAERKSKQVTEITDDDIPF